MSQSSRREFLSDSFFLAALTAAAVAVPSGVMAQPKSVRPSADKLRIGVIGLNGRGKAHIDGYLSNQNADVVAVCDIDLRTAEKTAAGIATKTGKKPKVYQDLRKLYEDKEIDAVSAALPIHWHSLAGIWAMQAGKDAYIEKPVSHNVSEGRRLSEAMTRYN
jgi:predicted dehydrogenase